MGKVVRRGASAREQAIQILRNGGTLDEAARLTGYGRDYVRQLGAQNGIRFSKRRVSSKVIASDYVAGASIQDLVKKYNYKGPESIYAALRIEGVPYRHKKSKPVVEYEERFCIECGTSFFCHPNRNKIFCCVDCQKKNLHRRHDVIRRTKMKAAIVDRDITLQRVCSKDGCKCYLCGNSIDWEDYHIINGKKFAGKYYPSIDHIVPLTRGGLHQWENVRLAHFSCNASKGANLIEELHI